MTHTLEPLEIRRLLAAAAAGTLDATFGHGGVVYVAEQTPYTVPTLGGAVTRDGKTLLLGQDPTFGDASHFRVTRLNADGSLDTSFGVGGSFVGAETSTLGGAANPTPNADLAIGADDSGRVYVLNDDADTVTRLTAGGMIDAIYGVAGVAQLPPSFNPSALLVRADGAVLLGGREIPESPRPPVSEFALRSLTPDGQVDTSFGSDGVAGVAFRYRGRIQDAAAYALSVDAKGRIVAAGGGDSFLDLVRFKPDGSLDKSFATGGAVRIAPSYRPGHTERAPDGIDANARFTAVTVRDSDGEIFAAASGETAPVRGQLGGGAWTVAAVKPGGRLDRAFGDGGVVRERVGSRRSPAQVGAGGIVIDASDQSVVVASATGGSARGLLMARFGSDGRADATFAPGLEPASVDDAGIRLLRATNPSPVGSKVFATGVLSRGDGFEVALQGTLARSSGNELTALLFNGGGSLVRSFGNHGIARSAPLQTLDVQSLTPLPSPTGGRVFAAVRDYPDAYATALSTAGAVDATFGAGGTVPLNGGLVLAVQPGGKLLVDAPPDPGGYDTDLLRLNADGTPDATFGTGGRVRFTGGPAVYGFNTTVRFRRLLIRPDGSMIAVVAQHSGPLSFVYGGNSDELQLLDASGVVLAAQDLPTEVEFFTVGADTDLIVTPDGGVLVPYGNENNNVSGGPFAGVLRFNADLTPDATLPAAPPPAGLPAVKDVRGAAMPDGSVVFAAPLDPGPGGVVLKMQPDGSYDASFGGGGLLTVPEAGAPVAEPDGKFLIAGKSADGKTVVVRRFNADGTADASFGDGAAFTLDLTSLGGAAGEVSAQLSPDGTSLYVATSATAANSNATQVGGTAPRVGVLVRLNL